MASASVSLCDGHLVVDFTSRTIGVTNGHLEVALSPQRMCWDGEPVSEVVAEALALTWSAASDE